MAEKLITKPIVEPISMSEARGQLYIEHNDHDKAISEKLRSARGMVEKYLNRALVEQTWLLQLDYFPRVIHMPRPPLQSVISIGYIDTAGDPQTLDAAEYYVDTVSEPGRIVPAFGSSWPENLGQIGAITVTYVAGYDGDGASPEDLAAMIPPEIKEAVKLVMTELYQNREINVAGVSLEFNPTVESLLFPYRVRPILN